MSDIIDGLNDKALPPYVYHKIKNGSFYFRKTMGQVTINQHLGRFCDK